MVTVPSLSPQTRRQTEAVEEAEMISEWASSTDAEWVRAIGALWEAFDRPRALEQEFESLVKALSKTEHGAAELRVVLAQLSERGYLAAVELAQFFAGLRDAPPGPPVDQSKARQPEPARMGWAFLRKRASMEQIAAALAGYGPLAGVKFERADADSLVGSGLGFTVKVTSVTNLKALLAEVKAVGRREEELRTCSMVLTLDVTFDTETYAGQVYSARSPMLGAGVLGEVPWEYVAACEALNIELEAHRPLVFDRLTGFYPQA